jgi:hypothetical protein
MKTLRSQMNGNQSLSLFLKNQQQKLNFEAFDLKFSDCEIALLLVVVVVAVM